MAYANANANPKSHFGHYHHPAPDPTITARRPSSYFDDDDASAVLDSGILDADIMQSPVDAQPRKLSSAANNNHNNNGVLTPVESHTWDPRFATGLTVDTSAASAQLYPADDVHGFSGRPTPHASGFVHPPRPDVWSYPHGSGHCTPTNAAELEFAQPPPPHGYEHAHHGHDHVRGSFSHMGPAMPPQHHPFNAPQPEPAFTQAPQVQTPLSPQSHQDWMTFAQQEVEAKRRRPHSPSRTSVDMQRRDGIRKKNGRIEIPQERTIEAIDGMIETVTDEDLLKELKQQKRLLRNREAALASRQRKKKHTEELESREKGFNNTLAGLESQITHLNREVQRQERSNQILMHQLDDARRQNEVAQEEKRDLVMRHSDETAHLRKKIQVLTEQLDAGPVSMSHHPSSTGFNDFTGGFEALTMDTHDWDFDIFQDFDSGMSGDVIDDLSIEPKHESTTRSPATEKRTTPTSSTIAPSSEKKSGDSSNEQPIASGLLFFLLLCGAFVASKPASSRPADLPQVPEDVRAAAPAVLNNLLSESAPSQPPTTTTHSGLEPGPSTLPPAKKSRGRLDQIHHRLTSPTKEQEAATAFALSTREYASISGMDYLTSATPSQPPPTRKRNLAEMLASMHDQDASNKAEVYTRSLLWDQIPTEVVRQFKEMVRDRAELEAREGGGTGDGEEMFGFKVEGFT